MDEKRLWSRRLGEIVEESRFWDAEDLIRNMEREMERFEQGLDHLIWGLDDRLVTKYPRPMPLTPRFKASSEGDHFTLKVYLPKVPRENVQVNIDRDSVEVYACSDDFICRPYYLDVEAGAVLLPDEGRADFSEGVLEVRVPTAKKRKVQVR